MEKKYQNLKQEPPQKKQRKGIYLLGIEFDERMNQQSVPEPGFLFAKMTLCHAQRQDLNRFNDTVKLPYKTAMRVIFKRCFDNFQSVFLIAPSSQLSNFSLFPTDLLIEKKMKLRMRDI